MKEVGNGVKAAVESVTNGENGVHLGTLGRHSSAGVTSWGILMGEMRV